MTYIPYKIREFRLNNLRGQIKYEVEQIDWGDDAPGKTDVVIEVTDVTLR